MAVTLLFKRTKASIGSVELDASVSETHQADVEVTEHPVEKGSVISDHARPKPETVVIEGLITNTPLPDPNADLVRLNSQGFDYDSRSELQPTRAGQAYADLLDLKNKAEPVTLVTALRTYENMVITALSVPRNARSGQALQFSATLKQIRFASAQRVKVTTSEAKTKSKANLGKKGAQQTPEEVKKKSFAKQGLGYVKGYLK